MFILSIVQNMMLLTNSIRKLQKTAERKESGSPMRLESRLPNRVRSWWNPQRSPRRQNHLPKTASSPSTTLSQTSKSLLVCIFDSFFPPTLHSVTVVVHYKNVFKSLPPICFITGTKPKDNTQFDPNRQAHDFKKKVFVCEIMSLLSNIYFISVWWI